MLLTVNSDLTCRVSGVDFGPLTLHHVDSSTLICKVKGHKVWSGRGQQRFVSARFILFTIVEQVSPSLFEIDDKYRSFNVKGPSQEAMYLAKRIQEGAPA